MAEAISPTSGRCYGVARICRVWEVPRSSFYAARKAGADGAGAEASPARRGPKPAVSDPVLLAAIRADLARSPWTGEGHHGTHRGWPRWEPGQGLGPAAGDGRHPGLAQARAAADAPARPALAASDPPASR